jgi:chromosomal replication initiation ATPase DnaA
LTKCESCGRPLEKELKDSSCHLMTDKQRSLHELMRLMHLESGITQRDLKIKRKNFGLVQSRAVFCKLAKEYTTASYPMIGRYIDRDHTTVIHSERSALSEGYEELYSRIKEKLDTTSSLPSTS